MTIEQAVTEYLMDALDPPVYFAAAPANAPIPRVVIVTMAPRHQYDTELRRVRLQVSVWDTDRYAAIALRENVYNVLQRYKGYMGELRVIAIAHDTGQVIWEPQDEVFHLPTDFIITYLGV